MLLVPVHPIKRAKFDQYARLLRQQTVVPLSDVPPDPRGDRGELLMRLSDRMNGPADPVLSHFLDEFDDAWRDPVRLPDTNNLCFFSLARILVRVSAVSTSAWNHRRLGFDGIIIQLVRRRIDVSQRFEGLAGNDSRQSDCIRCFGWSDGGSQACRRQRRARRRSKVG